jgi:hypothetical protein
VSLDGGTSDVATFTLTTPAPGHPLIGVGDQTVEVWVLAPATLSVTGVDVAPNPIDLNTGQQVIATAHLSNTGEIEGTFPVTLANDGVVLETRQVTIAADTSVDEVFVLTITHPGPQSVVVAGVEVPVTAYQLARPGNGEVIVNTIGGGPNRLVIENNDLEDVYVVLTAPGEGQPTLFGVYVHAGSSATLRGLQSGTYTAYFVHGADWCTFAHQFTTSPDYGVFADDLVFTHTSTMYTIYTLTFGDTDDWSPTNDVDPSDFPTG